MVAMDRQAPQRFVGQDEAVQAVARRLGDTEHHLAVADGLDYLARCHHQEHDLRAWMLSTEIRGERGDKLTG